MRAITKAETEKAVKKIKQAIRTGDPEKVQKALRQRAAQKLLQPDDYNGKIRHLKRKAKERK